VAEATLGDRSCFHYDIRENTGDRLQLGVFMSTSINIESADQVAFSSMLEHHSQLRAELDERVVAVRTALISGAPFAAALTALTGFLKGSIVPHALAEEAALYPTAADERRAEFLVDAMVLEHRELERRIRALAGITSGPEALAAAEGIAAVFAVHVDKENQLLLPALLHASDVSLATLLRDMEERFTEAQATERTDAPAPAEELDVRQLAHGSRHEVIFGRLHALEPGQRLVIVNDHDPKPLHYQLDAAWPGSFGWDYVEAGPQLWQVAITRLG
jgi:uncharacterized protein (DUF2249 family)/iron-sulfur cluster repair protein YtfE (RIC family)